MFKEDIMAKPATPAAIDFSYISEVLQVALNILQQHRNQGLAEKTFVMQEYLEMSKTHPERDFGEMVNKALADLTGAVHLHLNAELAAIAAVLERLSPNRTART
jgi:hypothetical protein